MYKRLSLVKNYWQIVDLQLEAIIEKRTIHNFVLPERVYTMYVSVFHKDFNKVLEKSK